MSNGIVHASLTNLLTVPTALGAGTGVFIITGDYKEAIVATILTGVGCQLQHYINPDNDQFGLVTAEWKIIKRFPVIGWLWVAVWDIYCRYLIPRHRHWLSHGTFIGTLIRFLYLWGVLYLLSFIIPYLDVALNYIYQYPLYALYVFFGLLIGDTGHIILDYSTPFSNFFEKWVAKK